MKDRPILFSAPMVRALLASTKTQTRRPLYGLRKSMPKAGPRIYIGTRNGVQFACWPPTPATPDEIWDLTGRELVTPGDRLWVKETWQAGASDGGPTVAYRANLDRWYPPFTGPDEGAGASFDYDAHPTTAWRNGYWIADIEAHGPWASPLHMPRWASRLTLTVTDVRVQRLHDISESDARAEGCIPDDEGLNPNYYGPARSLYEVLWNSINGAGSWDANPWVVAYSFTVHHSNIDAMPKEA